MTLSGSRAPASDAGGDRRRYGMAWLAGSVDVDVGTEKGAWRPSGSTVIPGDAFWFR